MNDELITNDGVDPAVTANGTPRAPTRGRRPTSKNALLGSRHDLVFLAGHFSANDALAADYTIMSSRRRARRRRAQLPQRDRLQRRLPLRLQHRRRRRRARRDAAARLGAGVRAEAGDARSRARATSTATRTSSQYSEQLYAEFARQLRTGKRTPVSVGDALVRAKQIYLQRNPSLAALDEKAVSRRRSSACR